jgi:homogentisate 1,2-dioxygenase
MPIYHTLGNIPKKRHTVFRKDNGELYAEELFGTAGFVGTSSIAYHLYPPTRIVKFDSPYSIEPEIAIDKNMRPLSFRGFDIPKVAHYLESRKPLFVNNDLHISLAAPSAFGENYFFKNADADEMIFIHRGSGTLQSMYGKLDFKYGDYIIIPRGTIYTIKFNDDNNRLLILESFSPIRTPSRYRNSFGQLLEHSPFCERDYKLPYGLETIDKKGEFKILTKKQGMIYPYYYANHPYDVIGWDGYNFPFAMSIHDFEPITGRIHQPPPVHQHFEGSNFVVCSFVPRMYDYHPDSIPAPYNHSNIDSDEILYYVDGDFMSRNNIEKGQLTLHPGGIPHGPHPGAAERSIGKKFTEELAVMIDPFNPMKITKNALEISDPEYYKSWIE